jgi:SAM-dependent methyltransferase
MRRWNTRADREFHDALFSGQQYNPFTFAYPGYITVRRFADLAAARLQGIQTAVDLGCGPGEITCELARRFPHVSFTGVDHSRTAIDRAREHVRSLGLSNIRFETGDVSTYRPPTRVGIVLMFDAFHHLLDPAGFVRASHDVTDRFLLLEPAGDWLGGWQKTIDLDWIPQAIDTIRERLAWQIGLAVKPSAASVSPPGSAGDPVEHRYTVADFQHFFDGFGLEIRGTVAGLEEYPSDAYGRPPLRNEFGRLAYDLIAGVDDILYLEDLDLHAKHWAVYAERGQPHRVRTPRPVNPRVNARSRGLQGACDVEYVAYDGPAETSANAEVLTNVTLRNRSWRAWSSDADAPIFLSYHWLGARSTVVEEDGLRTPLPRIVAPGETCTMSLRIRTPHVPGRYTLAVDMVEEGVRWFSGAGAPTRQVSVKVR